MTTVDVDWILAKVRGLHALLLRQQIEVALSTTPSDAPRWAEVLARIESYCDPEVIAAFDDDEAALMGAPWGAFAATDLALAAWRIEHLAVYLSATGVVDSLAPPTPSRPDLVEKALPMFVDRQTLLGLIEKTAAAGQKWTGDVVAGMADVAQAHGLWRWRIDAEWGHRRGQKVPGGLAFSSFVDERVRRMPSGVVTTQETSKGLMDLHVDGVAVGTLEQPTLEELRCLLHERLSAFAVLKAHGFMATGNVAGGNG